MTDPRDTQHLPATRSTWPTDWNTLQRAVQARDAFGELVDLIATERSLGASLNMPDQSYENDEPVARNEAASSDTPEIGIIPPADVNTLGDLLLQRSENARNRIADRREAIQLFAVGQSALDSGDFERAMAAFGAAAIRAPASRVIGDELSRCTRALEDARHVFGDDGITGTDRAGPDVNQSQMRELACAMAQARSLVARGESQRAIGKLRDLATEFPQLPGLQSELERLRRDLGGGYSEEAPTNDPFSGLEALQNPPTVLPASPETPAPRPYEHARRPGARVVFRWPESSGFSRGSHIWIKVIVAGATGLALLTTPVWLPALLSDRSPRESARQVPGRTHASSDVDQIATIGARPAARPTSLIGATGEQRTAWQLPSRSLDFVGALEESRTFRDPEGRFQFDYPGWDWTVTRGVAPAIVLIEKEDGGSIQIERGTVSPSIDRASIEGLIAGESEVVLAREPQADQLTVRLPRPSLALVVIDYRRPTDSGWEQVRQYSCIHGDEVFRLVASAPASRFTLVEGVFNLVARSFTPMPSPSH